MEQQQKFAEAVKRYLNNYQYGYLDYSFDQESYQFIWTVPVVEALGDLTIFIHCNKTGLLCRAHCKYQAQPHQYSRIIEYITRASKMDPWAGNFEFNYDEGEIIWKKHLRCSNQEPNPLDIEDTINCTLSMFAKYGNGLATLLLDNSDPETEFIKATQG